MSFTFESFSTHRASFYDESRRCTLLRLENIKKSYTIGKTTETILKGIDMQFGSGGFASLLGPSGSGKSTILNIIGGLDIADSGKLIFQGTDTSSYKEKDWDKYRKNHIGFVFQNFNLIPHLTALENVEITMTLSGLSKTERTEKAKELLVSVGLGDRMHHKPNELSGGQKQRVAIARALSNEPDIILADEPTGALDSETAESIIQLLKEIADSGKLVIVVTHSQELADQTDRVIEMKDGLIISDTVKTSREKVVQEKEEKPHFRLPYQTTIKLAWRNLWKKRWRTVLTSVGASIGIAGVVMMLGIGEGAQRKLDKELDFISAKVISVSVDKDATKQFTSEDLKQIEHTKDVEKVAGDYMFQVNASYKDKNSIFPLTSSFDSNADQANIIKGENVQKKNEVAITKKLAQTLVGKKGNIDSLLNKEVHLRFQMADDKKVYKTVDETAKVVGILKDGLFGMGYGVISVDFAKDIAMKSTDNDLKTTRIVVLAKTFNNVEQVKSALLKHKWNVETKDDQLKTIKGYVLAIQSVLALLASVSLIVSSIMIGIVLYISVLERTKEIGVLKAVGMRRTDIKRMFLSESAVIGFLGGSFGVIGAYLFGKIINFGVEQFLKENAFEAFLLPSWLAVGAILFSTIISIIAGYIPSRRASKLQAIDALRYE